MPATIPTLEILGSVHVLTAAECRAEAATCREQLAMILTPAMRRHLRREVCAWERLAEERS